MRERGRRYAVNPGRHEGISSRYRRLHLQVERRTVRILDSHRRVGCWQRYLLIRGGRFIRIAVC